MVPTCRGETGLLGRDLSGVTMKLNPLMQSALTFLVRRGVSLLGAGGAAVSDEWITQTVSLLLLAGNEGVQWWLAHRGAEPPAKSVTVKP